MFLADGAPFKEHLALFDQAFAACRSALRANPDDTSVRSNLGALYLWRDAFHPDESGNFEKAIDQFLIVLSRDPGNEEVLNYLRSYEVLVQIRPQLGDKGMDRIQSALRDTLKGSAGPANLSTLAAVSSFNGSMSEAQKAAETLVGADPGPSSYVILGSSELKMGHAEKALSSFKAALNNTADRVQMATAKLGAAQSYLAMSNIDAADSMWAEATASLPHAALDQAARGALLNTPAELGWAIGKHYADSGNVDRAFGYLGPEAANIFARKGNEAWNAGNKKEALDSFLSALQTETDQADTLMYAVGLLSFDLDHYGDSVWSLQQARDMGKELSENSLTKMGVSYLVLGDYQKAYNAFDEAHRKAPNDSGLREWRIGAAFGVGGWKMALDTLIEAPPLDLGTHPDAPRLRTFSIVYGVFNDAEQRARRAGLRYPRLSHLSALNELLSEVVNWSFGNLDTTALRKEKWDTLWEAINLYRELPLKPVPPKRAVDQEALAEDTIRNGNVQYYVVERAAIAATEIAPWWPEARYNLGVFARDCFYSVNLASLYEYSGTMSVWNNVESATQEFTFYLNLAPQGPQAAEVRQQLKKWGVELPIK